MTSHEFDRKSGFEVHAKYKRPLYFSAEMGGQSCPGDCPGPTERNNHPEDDPLGEPLTVNGVAKLIGCSAWTLRQRYIPAGLPHLRLGPNGKFIFYRNQIIRWLLDKQQKGGIRK